MPEGGGHLQGRPELTRYAGVRRAGPLLFVAGISSRQADNSIKGARSDGNGARFNEVYNRFFAASPPARTTIGVHELPDPALCIELKAIAYRPRRNRPVPEAI